MMICLVSSGSPLIEYVVDRQRTLLVGIERDYVI
jgi:hypothetical protein